MLEKIAKWLTRKPKLVAMMAVLMLIPAAIGYISTRINYDILSYLPEDLESSHGEKLLEEPFKMAATSMLVVESMPAGYTNSLLNDIKAIDGVSNAIWISNLMGIQIGAEFAGGHGHVIAVLPVRDHVVIHEDRQRVRHRFRHPVDVHAEDGGQKQHRQGNDGAGTQTFHKILPFLPRRRERIFERRRTGPFTAEYHFTIIDGLTNGNVAYFLNFPGEKFRARRCKAITVLWRHHTISAGR